MVSKSKDEEQNEEELNVNFFKINRRGIYAQDDKLFVILKSDMDRALPPPYICSWGKRKFYTFIDFDTAWQ